MKSIFESVEKSIQNYVDLEKEEYIAADIEFLNNRILSYWILKGVIQPINGGGKRRKLSFLELCWLKIVSELREYEISFDVIDKIKQNLFIPMDLKQADFSDFPDEAFEILAQHSPLSKKTYKEISIQMKPVYSHMKLGSRSSSYLELMILRCLGLRTPISIIVYGDGEYMPFMENYITDYFSNEQFVKIFRGSHLSISISNLISYYIQNEEFTFPYRQLFITEEEEKIIEILKKEKPKSVTIRFNNKNTIDLVEIENFRKVDIRSRISELLMTGGFEDIIIKTQNGEIVSCKKITKIKF